MPHFECGAFDHSATSPQRVGAHIPSCAAPHKVARANNDAEMLPWAGGAGGDRRFDGRSPRLDVYGRDAPGALFNAAVVSPWSELF